MATPSKDGSCSSIRKYNERAFPSESRGVVFRKLCRGYAGTYRRRLGTEFIPITGKGRVIPPRPARASCAFDHSAKEAARFSSSIHLKCAGTYTGDICEGNGAHSSRMLHRMLTTEGEGCEAGLSDDSSTLLGRRFGSAACLIQIAKTCDCIPLEAPGCCGSCPDFCEDWLATRR